MQRNPIYAYTPRNFSKRTFNAPQRKKRNWWKIFLWIIASFLFLWIVWVFSYLQIRILKDLPDVSHVKNMTLSEATVITDRNWEVLYKIFDENREFIPLSWVNQHMIDAIISVEDQDFWNNEWLDPMWIFRAWFMAMIWKNGWWGSTITQQLITNIMNLERPFWWSFLDKVDYKLKQIILAKRLNNVLQKQIRDENKKLTSSQIKQEMKRKILELYLNYVFLGNNSYWVETASKTYFNKSAKDLTILESAILSAIPKAPSRYDPFKSSSSLRWKFKILDWNGTEYPFEGNLKSMIISKYKENIRQANFSNKNTSEAFIKFVISLCPSSVTIDGKTYSVSYVNWRAEFALWRLFEDWKISEEELKDAFIESLTITFEKNYFDIKAPHFVFWIKDILEKEYWTWVLKQWGFTIKTTLDYSIQQMAESSLKNNWNSFFENGATNGSMLYFDSQNWDVLAYVWSLDYFNNEIEGQNDMVRNPRQSWSSIKPLIYALWFEKLPLTLDTPIYDIKFSAGDYTPNNADGKFEWMLSLKRALWYSRNIPAVKLFIALWWESVAKPFLQSLGLSWVKDDNEYWYSLALGAAEISMLELWSAYSYLSTETPAVIDPILEIKNNKWEILYSKEIKKQENRIKPGIISLMWNILSDPSNRIWSWSTKFNVKWLTYALKTWTSNVQTDKWSRPRDGWLAAYTPSKVILMWAWNANASAMNRNAYWWTIHANSIKSFLSQLLEQNLITNEQMPMKDVSSISISSISWKLPSESTPQEFIKQTLWWNYNLPKEVEWPITPLEVDISCYWKISPLTPPDQVRKWYLIEPSTFMPNKMDLENIIEYLKEWVMSWNMSINLFVEEPKDYCEARQPEMNESIQINIIKPQDKQSFAKKNSIVYSIKSPVAVKKINILLDWSTVKSFIDNSTDIYWTKDIDLSNYWDGSHTLGIMAVDANNAVNLINRNINLVSEDTMAPYLNRDGTNVIRNEDWKYDVTLLFNDDVSWIKSWKIIGQDWKNVNTFSSQATSFVTSNNVLKLEVSDYYDNVLSEEINLDTFL